MSDDRRVDVDHRPTLLGSVLAVLAAVLAAGVLANAPGQRLPVAGTAAGVTLLVVGARYPLHSGGRSAAGSLVAALGAVVLAGSLLRAVVTPLAVGERVTLVLALVGVALVGLGVYPVSQRAARRVVSAGLAALVAAVAVSGVFQRTDPLPLLVATAAALVAWDSAEHAVSLGEQLRTDATTRAVELLHAGVAAGYGALLVGAALLLFDFGASGLPLATLVALLGGAVLLLAALYR